MTTYIDVETSPEALQEDEELIEAVNELVGSVSESVKAEIESEVSEFVALCKRVIVFVFPAILDYQEEPARIKEDLEKLAIFLVVLLAAVWVLAPSKRRRKITYDNRPTSLGNKGTGWLSRSLSSGRVTDASNNFFVSCRHPNEEDSESEKVLSYNGDDETDEERFEKMWSISIVNSGYSKLVLPPSCRRINDGGKRNPKKQITPRTSNIQAMSKHKDSPVNASDDDNPAARLQYYVRQLWFFIRSLISYDYTTAGKTLIMWLQGIQRIQHHHRSSRNTSEGADNDNSTVDESVDGLKLLYDDEKKEDAPAVGDTNGIIITDIGDPDDDNSIAEEDTSSSHINTPTTQQQSPSRSQLHGTDETGVFVSPLQDSLGEARSPLHEGEVLPELPWIKSKPLVKNGRHESDGSVYFDPPITSTTTTEDSSCHANDDDGRDRFPLRVALPGRSLLQQRRHQPTSEALSMDIVDRTHIKEEESNERNTTMNPWLAKSDELSSSSDKPIEESPMPMPESSHRHFFDTASSRDSLKKMSVEIPVPDKNGYILGDAFLPDSTRYTPLLVFVNSRSGPQQGHLLITQLRRLLNPIQVWDLADGGPKSVLQSFLVLSRLRVLVCGGDGTVSWIVNTLEEMKINQRQWPPIAILPLGTGNDLARIHGWGGGYNNESLITILEQISESYSSLLDRWEVTIHEKKSKKKDVKGFFNYLGVGADAQAALQVHYLRESRPEWFFSRMVNKAMYGLFGAEDMIKATTVNVRKEIKLVADGVEVPLPPDSQGIILLNIDAYAGGVPLWSHGVNMHFPAVRMLQSPRRTRSMTEFDHMNVRGRNESMDRVDSVDDLQNLMSAEERFAHVTACDMPSSCQDGYLDVVSIRGAFHLGQIKVGLSNAQRLCQCREATITIKNKVAVQVDGEPWRQRSCTLTVKRKKDPAVMLHRSADDGGVETEMSKLLDWAEARNMIDSQVHAILMKEFSRRIESKTRQRRVRAKDNIMSTLKKAISSGAMVNLSGSQHNAWQGSGGIAF